MPELYLVVFKCEKPQKWHFSPSGIKMKCISHYSPIQLWSFKLKTQEVLDWSTERINCNSYIENTQTKGKNLLYDIVSTYWAVSPGNIRVHNYSQHMDVLLSPCCLLISKTHLSSEFLNSTAGTLYTRCHFALIFPCDSLEPPLFVSLIGWLQKCGLKNVRLISVPGCEKGQEVL